MGLCLNLDGFKTGTPKLPIQRPVEVAIVPSIPLAVTSSKLKASVSKTAKCQEQNYPPTPRFRV